MSDIETSNIDQKKHRPVIEAAIDSIKDHKVMLDLFSDYNVQISEIQYIPICFAEIDVSARTDHACIYVNIELVKDKSFEESVEAIAHYLVHEISHWAQQTTGTKPTKGSEDGDYLENEHEVEGFQNQVEFIADVEDEETAGEYVDQVLDHHDSDGKEREDKKEELMKNVANRRLEFFKLIGA